MNGTIHVSLYSITGVSCSMYMPTTVLYSIGRRLRVLEFGSKYQSMYKLVIMDYFGVLQISKIEDMQR